MHNSSLTQRLQSRGYTSTNQHTFMLTDSNTAALIYINNKLVQTVSVHCVTCLSEKPSHCVFTQRSSSYNIISIIIGHIPRCQTSSYKEHLPNTADKLKSWNNLLSKLAGSSWDAIARTLHTSALALYDSVAEYCCPASSWYSHTSSINSQLDNTVWLISGCVRPTQDSLVAWWTSLPMSSSESGSEGDTKVLLHV